MADAKKQTTKDALAKPLPRFGQLFDESLQMLKERFWKFVGIQLFAMIPLLGLVVVFLLFALVQVIAPVGADGSSGVAANIAMIVLGILGIVALLGVILFALVAHAAMLIYLRDYSKEERIKPALTQAWSQWWGLFVVEFLRAIIAIIGFVLLIVPGIYWSVKYFFSPYAYIFEKEKGAMGFAALQRGYEIINNYRWGVYARILVATLLVVGASFVYQMASSLILGVASIGDSVVWVIISGLLVLVLTIVGFLFNVGIQSFVKIFNFNVFAYTYNIKQKSRSKDVYHPFSTGKKVFVIILVALMTLLPLAFAAIVIATADEELPDYEGYHQTGPKAPLETTETQEPSPVAPGNELEVKVLQPPQVQGAATTRSPQLPELFHEAGLARDADEDGLTDIEELYEWKSDPLNSDTDSDGLSDWDELHVWSTDLLDSDSDDDGYLDGEEVSSGYNPLGRGQL